jgi:hypothetical protein
MPLWGPIFKELDKRDAVKHKATPAQFQLPPDGVSLDFRGNPQPR